MNIDYDNKSVTNITDTKFFVIFIDNTFAWNRHINQMIRKLNAASYAVWKVKPFISQDTLTVVY